MIYRLTEILFQKTIILIVKMYHIVTIMIFNLSYQLSRVDYFLYLFIKIYILIHI